MSVWDFVNQDPFTLTNLADWVEKRQYVPGQVGAMGLFEESGVLDDQMLIEELAKAVALLPVKPRGAPGTVVGNDKRKMRPIAVPHIPQQGAISADTIRKLRMVGTENQRMTVEQIRNANFETMLRQTDYTIESHRVAAMKGNYVDNNGDTQSACTFFGVAVPSTISLALNVSTTALETKALEIIDAVETALGGTPYTEINAWLNKDLWALFKAHPMAKEAFTSTVKAAENANKIVESFVLGNIRWHRYRGDSSVNFGTKGGIAFPVGVPGMYRTWYAPSTWLESVGGVGLPYYTKAFEGEEGDNIQLRAQSNPLNICVRPDALIPINTP